MRRWPLLILATAMLSAGAFARGGKNQPAISNDQLKLLRKDPAFVAGYDDGYRRGGNDSEALGGYRDEGGDLYAEASDGYTPQYGDKLLYQQRFRVGYVLGYKDGWDSNSGFYNRLGAGSW